MDILEQRHIENNEQYTSYEHTIDSMQSAIRREVPHLIQEFQLTVDEIASLNEYIDDRATLFRFLRKNKYSLPTSLSLILDTIRWRILGEIDKIRISTVQHFLDEPLVYFHKVDKLNRPVLIVNLAYLPKAPADCYVTEFLTPLVIFVLETARLLTWDLTKQRTEEGIENPLVLDTVVLVEFKNANSLPTDITLLKSFVTLLRRYPGMTGTVNLINFGWMYQGLWQMCKLVLSEEAKSRVSFPKVKNLKTFIDEDNLLIDFGGNDPFVWDASLDPHYTKYRETIHITPPTPPRLSRRNSNTSIYFDTLEPLTRPASSFSLYATPISSLTPVASHTNLASVAKAYSSLSLNSKIGNNMPPRLRTTIKTLGDLFVTPNNASSSSNDSIGGISSWALSEKLSTIQRQQQQQEQDETPLSFNNDFNYNNNNNNNKTWIYKLYIRCENAVRYVTVRILKKMVKYRGTLYWIVACILLRNGVQELIQHVFMLMMQVLLNSNSASNAVGLRSLLRISAGQMTL